MTNEEAWEVLLNQGHRCALSDLPINLFDGSIIMDFIDETKPISPDNIRWIHKDIYNMKKSVGNFYYFLDLCNRVTNFTTPLLWREFINK